MRSKYPATFAFLTVSALLLAVPAVSAPAQAQSTTALGGVGEIQTITARAKVQAVNLKTRDVTLVNQSGEVFVVQAGPGVQNLAQVKVGQTVIVHYYASVAFVLSKPNANTPENTAMIEAARNEKGQLPGGLVAERTIVTGMVVSVDLATHRLQLVNPSGGRVITVNVTDPQRQQALASVNVGDRLTTVITRAVAIGIEPAK
jgi:hypothetical protein